MAAGIAHDFNNALTMILGHSDLMMSSAKGRAEADSPEVGHVRASPAAAQDAAQIVRRLREFHRPDEGEETRVTLQLNQIVEQAITMTRPKWMDEPRARGREVSVHTDLAELPPLAGDPAELREMLTNLVFNAVDAMPEGGSLRLQTSLDDGELCLRVSDTGTGMDDETRRRCLEPFFTTKGEKGTGLGLSAVYGIIQRHGGMMEIESEKGTGTTFCIRLPASLVEPESPAQAGGSEAPKETAGILRILVVDDLPIIRDVLQAQLVEDGHEVETAGDGKEALETLEKGCFDLMITDQSMPGMTGEQLAVKVKQHCPKTAVILLTGFGGDTADTKNTAPGVDMVLGKPATSVELRRAIGQFMK